MNSNVFQKLSDAYTSRPYKQWPRTVRWPLELLLLILLFSLASSWVSRHMLNTDEVAPTAVLMTLDGQSIELDWSSSHGDFPSPRASRTLLYFFAPWCGICRVSMPGLNVIPTDNLRIYAVALDFNTQEEVEQFVTDVGYEGTVLLGTDRLRDQFQIRGYPSYYVIDDQGKIRHRDQGLSTPPGLWLRTHSF